MKNAKKFLKEEGVELEVKILLMKSLKKLYNDKRLRGRFIKKLARHRLNKRKQQEIIDKECRSKGTYAIHF